MSEKAPGLQGCCKCVCVCVCVLLTLSPIYHLCSYYRHMLWNNVKVLPVTASESLNSDTGNTERSSSVSGQVWQWEVSVIAACLEKQQLISLLYPSTGLTHERCSLWPQQPVCVSVLCVMFACVFGWVDAHVCGCVMVCFGLYLLFLLKLVLLLCANLGWGGMFTVRKRKWKWAVELCLFLLSPTQKQRWVCVCVCVCVCARLCGLWCLWSFSLRCGSLSGPWPCRAESWGSETRV